uniref:Aminopeptidase n=1 Tax=Clastoptera arizonana TaxID=38151 RepID=A0A1B6C237_9HEMI
MFNTCYFVLATCIVFTKALLHETDNTTALYRINHIYPTNYHLHFIPYYNNFTFYGFTQISFTVTENLTELILNAVDLTTGLSNVTLTTNNTINVNGVVTLINTTLKSVRADELYQRLVIEPYHNLPAADYNITVRYYGVLRDSRDLNGLYYGTHYINDKLTYYATTQFEAMSARKAFPCFDEPVFHAPTVVHIARLPEETTISNMPPLLISNPDHYGERVWDVFNTSPSMVSYLVAFFVGQFANITSGKYTVYARPHAINQGEYALGLMAPVIEALENFTGVNYSLPKLDLVALPDFSAGAMENWGMTSFRESYALVGDGVTSEYYLDYVLQLIAHEFAHQWFGDLVTTEWWGNIWLNEGFATYFQHTISALIKPSWRFEEAFSVRAVQVGLEADVSDTHPMTHSAFSVNDTKFDDISYRKAGAVIKMVERTVTLDVFKKALNSYLNNTSSAARGVATPELLYGAFENVVKTSSRSDFKNDFNFTTFIESWTLTSGYPLVTVQVENGVARVSQQIFTNDATNTTQGSWYIPLTYTTEAEKDFTTLTPKIWLRPKSQVEVSVPNDGSWVIFNILQSGFYRVNYDANNWNVLIKHLKQDLTQIPPVNRGQLIDDGFHLATNGYINYTTLFSLTEYLRNEVDYVPWQVAMKNFKKLIFYFQGTDLGETLKVYVRGLYSTYYHSVAQNYTKDHVTKLGKIDALQFACDLGYKDCETFTLNMYKMWYSSAVGFPPEIKTAALCSGIRDDPSAVPYVFQKYTESNVFSDKVEFLKALACTTDVFMLNDLLTRALLDKDRNTIRAQHVSDFFNKVIERSMNIDTVISFFKSHYGEIADALGERKAKQLASSLANKVIKDYQVEKLLSVVQDESFPQNLRDGFNSTIPAAMKRLQWIKNSVDLLIAAVTQYQDLVTSGSSSLAGSLFSVFVLLLILYNLI